MNEYLLNERQNKGPKPLAVVRGNSFLVDVRHAGKEQSVEEIQKEKVTKAATFVGLAWEVLDGKNLLFSPLNGQRPLKYYVRSAWLSFIADVAVIGLIMLSFITRPRWMTNTMERGMPLDIYPMWFDYKHYVSNETAAYIELALLPFIIVDISMKKFLLAEKFWPGGTLRSPIMPFWVQCFTVLFYVIEYTVSNYVMVSPDRKFVLFLRILIFVCRRHQLWNLWMTTFHIVYAAKDVLIFQAVFVLLTGWFSFCLFAGSEFMETYSIKLRELLETHWDYFVLLSGVNFPSVMVDIYDASRPSSLFFIAYITIGCFFLMNLILASVVELFNISKQAANLAQKKGQSAHLEAAFDMLRMEDGNFVTHDMMESLFQEMGKLGMVKNTSVRKFTKATEQALFEMHGSLIAPDDTSCTDVNNRQIGAFAYSLIDFEECVGLLLASIKLRPRKTQMEKFFPKTFRSQCWQRLIYFVCELNTSNKPVLSYFLGEVKVFEVLVDMLVTANLVFLFIFILGCAHIPIDDGITYDSCVTVSKVQWLFFALYDLELVLKVLCYGWHRYWVSPINKFDFVNIIAYNIVMIPFIAEVVRNTISKEVGIVGLVNVVRLFRIFRIFYSFRKSRMIIKRVIAVAYQLRTLLLLVFSYVFIADWIGVLWFGGRICQFTAVDTDASYTDSAVSTCNLNPGDSEYADAGYLAINFNDMFSGFVTIFVLLMVNDWVVINDAFVDTTGSPYARIYFALNYFFGVVVILNVVIAFVISSLISQDQFKRRQHLLKRVTKDETFVPNEEEIDELVNPTVLKNTAGSTSILEWAKNPREEEYNFGLLACEIKKQLSNQDARRDLI